MHMHIRIIWQEKAAMNLRKNGWSMERDGGRKDVTGKKKILASNFSKSLKNKIIIGKQKV